MQYMSSQPICVSVCLADIVRWNKRFYNQSCNFKDSIFYDLDKNAGTQGMQPKAAFELLTRNKEDKISDQLPTNYKYYAKINSTEMIQGTIVWGVLIAVLGLFLLQK